MSHPSLAHCLPPAMFWDGPAGAAALLDKVCKHPFPSIPLMYELAHVAMPNEQRPRCCRSCKQRPFVTVSC
eukprot:1007192-Pleurochrysis_carterae.AAC.4